MVLRYLFGRQTQEPSNNSAIACQLPDDLFGKIHGNGKTNAASLGADGRSDGYHFSARVKQRSATVAKVDGCAGLDVALKWILVNLAIFGTDDTDGDRVLVIVRITHRHHPIPDSQ